MCVAGSERAQPALGFGSGEMARYCGVPEGAPDATVMVVVLVIVEVVVTVVVVFVKTPEVMTVVAVAV